jgi:ASF1 like histone chaperone
MAAVDIFDVRVLDNPAPFTNPLQFEITYDVREPLKEGTLPLHHRVVLFLRSRRDATFCCQLFQRLLTLTFDACV